jgi:hypothetical protein
VTNLRLIVIFCHSQEYCNDEKASDIHLEFMKAIDACQVKYIPEKV